jgi:folate-binding protein YgfZ
MIGPFVAAVPRTKISVVGDDSTTFLQGQLSQDLDQLDVGGATWSYLLTPQGKTIALLRVWREDKNGYSLLVETTVAELVAERLETFLFRAEASISTENIELWCCRGAKGLGYDSGWPGLIGTDSLAKPDDLPIGNFEQLETVRIGSGVPSNEKELNVERIPQELSFVDDAISFTKGCYVGQELVARIHSRGRVTRRMCGLVFESHGFDAKEGMEVTRDDAVVGEISSIAPQSVNDKRWALAFIRHDVDYGQILQCIGSGAKAHLRSLPLLNFSK